MKQINIKKLLLLNLPYLLIGLFATKLGQAWRLAAGVDASTKLLHLPEGFAAAILALVSRLMMWPYLLAVNNMMEAIGPITNEQLSDPIAVGQFQAALLEQMQGLSIGWVLLALGGVLLTVAVHVLIGLFGTRIYRRRCLNKVRAIRENEKIDNKLQALSLSGGVNLLLAAIALYALPILLNLLIV